MLTKLQGIKGVALLLPSDYDRIFIGEYKTEIEKNNDDPTTKFRQRINCHTSLTLDILDSFSI